MAFYMVFLGTAGRTGGESLVDDATARLLRDETERFYDTCAASFGATRKRPWEGWRALVPRFSCCFERAQLRGRLPLVLDVGCGNFRFERFLRGAVDEPWRALGLDSCRLLSGDPPLGSAFRETDLTHWRPAREERGRFDLVVCFGVLHHIPGTPAREALVRDLARCVAPGGLLALSLWQLQKSERQLRQARETTARFLATHPNAELDPGDWLLPWQGREGVVRYCHGFSNDECARLATVTGLDLLDVFDADRANRYVVLSAPSDEFSQ